MAATVQIVGYYAGVKTAVATQRYSTTDAADPGLSYPCNVPPEGETYYSFWVYTGLEITGGTFSQVTYLRAYGPGSIGTTWNLGSGMVVVALKDAGDHGIPVGSIEVPTGTEGLTGYSIKDATHGVTFYKGETVELANFSNYTTAAPLVFDNDTYTEAGVTKLICHQLVLEDDTTFGEKDALTYGIRWREI